MSLLAEVPEITAGLVVVALLAIVSPLAILAGVFLAIGRHRQRQDHSEKAQAKLETRVEGLLRADVETLDKLRSELDGHARLLSDRITNEIAAEVRARDQAMRALDSRVLSMERWRERMIGAAEAARYTRTAIPRQVGPDDPTPLEIPTPRIHQRSGHYPGIPDDDEES